MDEENIYGIFEGLGNNESSTETEGRTSETRSQRRKANTSAGNTASGAETGSTEEVVPRPAVLNIPTPGGSDEKPKKKRVSKKDNSTTMAVDPIMQENITLMLKSGFDLLAVPMGEHWRISNEEAATVGQPAARVLTRLGAGEAASKYADYFVLLGAVAVITIPRVIISSQLRKVVSAKNVIQRDFTGGKSAGKPSNAPLSESGGESAGIYPAHDTGNVKGAIPGLLG